MNRTSYSRIEKPRGLEISFKSNYKMPLNTQTSNALGDLYKFCRQGVEIYEHFDFKITSSESFGKVIIDADDKFDEKIEALLKVRGIKFHKQSKGELMELDNIFSRIKLSEYDETYDRQLVVLDTQKVEKLFKINKDAYIAPKGKGGIGDRYNQFISYLKTGQDIDASRLHIREENGRMTLSFIDGRHRFCVLRDMGMKKIPFAMDTKSYYAAKKTGLVV